MDDQRQPRIRFETEAILRLLRRCEQGEWELVGSNFVAYEFNKHKNEEKKKMAYGFYECVNIIYDAKDYPETQTRANVFQSVGVGSIDSLHLAMAENADVSVLLTTDDDFIKTAKRTDSKVRVINPLEWIMEVTGNE
jgi:predicted nucleic acid-binding protein